MIACPTLILPDTGTANPTTPIRCPRCHVSPTSISADDACYVLAADTGLPLGALLNSRISYHRSTDTSTVRKTIIEAQTRNISPARSWTLFCCPDFTPTSRTTLRRPCIKLVCTVCCVQTATSRATSRPLTRQGSDQPHGTGTVSCSPPDSSYN